MAEVTKPLKVGNVWTNLIDSKSGDSPNFEIREYDLDGVTPLTDSSCDGILYRKDPEGGYAVDTDYINTTVVNVKRFGAKGDGTTDDTAAIQAAFDAAPRKSKIFFPAGVYVVTSQLNIPTGKEWVFSGVGRKTNAGIGWSSQYNGMSVILYRGQGVSDEACIKAEDSNFTTSFKHLTIFNGTSRTDVDGINLPWFTHGYMDDCYIAGFKVNLYIGGDGWHSVITRTSLRQAKEANFYMVGVPNGMSFRDCRVQDSLGHGFVFENAASEVVINGTSIERNALYAIDLQESGGTYITDCHFENNGLSLEEEYCIVRWRREQPGVLPKVLHISNCTARLDSGIHFVGASATGASIHSRMRLIFEGNILHTGAEPGPSLETYALNPISTPAAITAVFIGNNGLSRTDLNADYIRDCPNPNELFKYTSINCGLALRMSTAGRGSEALTTTELRANALFLPPSTTTDGGITRTTAGPSISTGFANPEGNVVADPGSLYIRSQTTTPVPERVFIKTGATGTDTGWVQLRTQPVTSATTGDANDFLDGTIMHMASGSSVLNLPPTDQSLYIHTFINPNSPATARQVAYARHGQVFTRMGGASLYNDGWTELGRVLSGGTADRPTVSISIGTEYFDTDLGHPVWWDGADWVNALPDVPNATTTTKGLVNQMGAIANIAVPDAAVADDCIPLANANKAKIDQILIAMRNAGLLAT